MIQYIGVSLSKSNYYLLGGDIVKSNCLSITITIFGLINKAKYIKRSGAKIHDDIWVTGNIGDSHIGYKILKNKLTIRNKVRKKGKQERQTGKGKVEVRWREGKKGRGRKRGGRGKKRGEG